jgi:quinol monooxygenase YgiN
MAVAALRLSLQLLMRGDTLNDLRGHRFGHVGSPCCRCTPAEEIAMPTTSLMSRRGVLPLFAATFAAADGSAAPARGVSFTVTLHVKPGLEQRFLDLLTPVLDAMRHESTFINAVLHRDPDDPTRFMLYETWADLDDVVQVQLKRAYRSAYHEALPSLLREERGISVWQPLRADFATG